MTVPPTDPVEALSGPAEITLSDKHVQLLEIGGERMMVIRDPALLQRLDRIAAQLDTTPSLLVARWLNDSLGDA